ncbi:MAG: hypothetical protein WC208_11100 [Gallionella sp.]
MSLLSLSELCIIIYPDQLALLNVAYKPTLRGLKRRVHAQNNIPCEAAVEGDMPWSCAIRTLATSLPLFARRNMKVTVILSNQFMHYVLVPWYDKLGGEKEEMAYARHCFGEVYGDAADAWELRLSPDKAGVPALASAVDKDFLDVLRGLLVHAGVKIKSIQPHLMAAHNISRTSLQGRSAWLALLEPGNLCLAMLQKGQWTWMRKMRIGEAWHEELPTILAREECLTGTDATVNEVLLWAPHLGFEDGMIPASRRWKFQHLKASQKYGFGMEHDVLSGTAVGS